MSSGSASETFAVSVDQTEAEARAEAVTYVDVDTAAETVARYVGRDVRYLARSAHINLGRELCVPQDIAQDDTVVVELLMHDIERMLRKGLISEVHLILSDQDVNANNQVTARYHARYEVRGSTARHGAGIVNDIVKAPPRTLANAHFALCISWSKVIRSEKKKEVRPPEYFFVWTPERRHYDETGLVRYRFGGIDAGAIQVTRTEYTDIKYLR